MQLINKDFEVKPGMYFLVEWNTYSGQFKDNPRLRSIVKLLEAHGGGPYSRPVRIYRVKEYYSSYKMYYERSCNYSAHSSDAWKAFEGQWYLLDEADCVLYQMKYGFSIKGGSNENNSSKP